MSYSPWGHKSLDMTEHAHVRDIKKETNKQMREVHEIWKGPEAWEPLSP